MCFKPTSPNRLRGWLIGAACLALTQGAAAGDPARKAQIWQPQALAPTAEAPQPRAAAVAPDVPANDTGAPSTPEKAVRVQLKDIPAGKRPSEQERGRVHIQGAESAATRDSDGARALFPTTPANPASARPLSDAQRDPGDAVRLFDGIDSTQSSWRPPDMQIAVGPQYVVEAANSGFALYTKTGLEASPYLEYEDFLASNVPAGWDGFMFDPRIVYDPNEQRYVMLVLGRDDTNQEAYFWLAVSETSDPRDGWCIRRYRVTQINATTTGWLDFAALGTDAFGVYVTGNHIEWGGPKFGAAIRSYPNEVIDTCGSGAGWKFTDVQWPSGGDADSLQPAHAHSVNGNEETYFVGTRPFSGDQVLLAKLSGDRANSPTLTRVEIDIPAYNAIENNVNQPGSAADIDGGKSKAISAIYANRRVFFSLTTDVQNNGTSSGWLTVKLNSDANTNDWHHLLWSGEDTYLFYPALTLDGPSNSGHLAVFGSWAHGTDDFASTVYKIYENQPTDSTGRFQTPLLGTAAYNWPDENGRNRWGDYSGASYDWTCGHAWGVAQSATGTQSWKTHIIARKFDDEPDCPLLYATAPAGGAVLNSGDVVTVRWNKANLPATDELIVLVIGDGLLDYVAQDLPTTATSVQWTVPENPGDAYIAVGSWDGSSYTVLHYGDPFTIVDATAPSPDPLRFTQAPAPDSQSAIRMSVDATDGAGGDVEYRFFLDDSPTGGSGGDGTTWDTNNEHVDTGLSTNHQYCYAARARDELQNTTEATSVRCAYTLSAPPLARPFSDITTSRITLNWGANGNPDFTEFQVLNVTRGLVTGWINALSWQTNPLDSGTTYEFRVRSRNGDDVRSDWVNFGTATTLSVDTDGDGVDDNADNCLGAANPAQIDADGDGLGNVCDADLSQDCVVNVVDLGLLRGRFFTNDPVADFNGDGVVNVQDLGIMRLQFFDAPGPSGIDNACAAAP